MDSILSELKRRNVFRVLATYLVVSWLLVQLTNVAMPALHLPPWSDSFVFFLLAAGLPIALITAWAFELTPEGLRRTTDSSDTIKTPVRIGDYVLLGGIVLIAGAIVYSGVMSTSDDSASFEGDASIAVLPFENLSTEAEELMFSEGLTSTVRGRLAAVPGMRVASRSGSIQFAEGGNTPEIAQSLGVRAILEGSVQKVGPDLRVMVQLIDADRGFQVWSATVERQVDNLMVAQAEISDEIVDRVRDTLQPEAEPDTAERRSRTGPKVDLAERARALLAERTRHSITGAIDLYTQVLKTDHENGEAHAAKAEAHILLARSQETYGEGSLLDALSVAKPYAAEAVRLAPDSPYSHAVQGLVELTCGDTDKAIATLEHALSLNPQYATAHHWLFLAKRAAGDEAGAYASLERAYAAARDSIPIALNMSQLLVKRNRVIEAEALLSRLEESHPDNPQVMTAMAAVYADTWQPARAIEILETVYEQDRGLEAPHVLLGLTYLDIGDTKGALKWLGHSVHLAYLAGGDTEIALESTRTRLLDAPESLDAVFALADAESAAGHPENVVKLLSPFRQGNGATGPLFDRTPLLLPAVTLAQANLALGHEEEARALLADATDYVQAHREMGLRTPQIDYLEARILALEGSPRAALDHLRRAVARRFAGISVITWDPALAPLRNEQLFQDLIADLEADQARMRAALEEMRRSETQTSALYQP